MAFFPKDWCYMQAHIQKGDSGVYCRVPTPPILAFVFESARYAAANYDPRGMDSRVDLTKTLHACPACCDKVKEQIEKERAAGFIDYGR